MERALFGTADPSVLIAAMGPEMVEEMTRATKGRANSLLLRSRQIRMLFSLSQRTFHEENEVQDDKVMSDVIVYYPILLHPRHDNL